MEFTRVSDLIVMAMFIVVGLIMTVLTLQVLWQYVLSTPPGY